MDYFLNLSNREAERWRDRELTFQKDKQILPKDFMADKGREISRKNKSKIKKEKSKEWQRS